MDRRPILSLAAVPLAFAVYGLLALLAYRPILPGESSHIATCACGDPALQTWFLAWVPYSLGHGLNPLFTDWTNYPAGINLVQNTAMPLLGLLTAPVTIWVSPIASWNLLLWLAFPASATAMFFVARRWTGSAVGAFAAGLLYGFSAYVVGQAVGHVMLSFVPIPPLFFYQLHKVVVRRGAHPYRSGLVLGVLGALQFFIDVEILASLIMIGSLAILLLVVTNLRALTGAAIGHAARGLAAGGALTAVLIAYPTWYLLYGPQHISGAVQPDFYQSSLLGPVLTTRSQHFAPHFLLQYGLKLGFVENGAYLGLPLILLVAFFAIRFRHNRWLLFCVGMSLISFLLSLGSHLVLVTNPTSFRLPFFFIEKLPLVRNMLPSRLSMYVSLFVASAVGIGIAETISQGRRTTDPIRSPHLVRGARAHWTVATAGVLGVAAVVALLPNWPYVAKTSNVPRFFTTNAVKRIPAGAVVLTYPFPDYPYNQAMMWQAVSAMRFKEVGTYAITPTSLGTVTLRPPLLAPAPVEDYLAAAEGLASSPPPPPTAQLVSDLRLYLRTYKIEAVVVARSDPTVLGVPIALALFTDALGPPQTLQGVSAWFDVPALIRAGGTP